MKVLLHDQLLSSVDKLTDLIRDSERANVRALRLKLLKLLKSGRTGRPNLTRTKVQAATNAINMAIRTMRVPFGNEGTMLDQMKECERLLSRINRPTERVMIDGEEIKSNEPRRVRKLRVNDPIVVRNLKSSNSRGKGPKRVGTFKGNGPPNKPPKTVHKHKDDNRSEVVRNLVGELPSMAEVNSEIVLTLTFTAEDVSEDSTARIDAPVGSTVYVRVRALEGLSVVDKRDPLSFKVEEPQRKMVKRFRLRAGAAGQGRVRVDVSLKGMPVSGFECTTRIVATLGVDAIPEPQKKTATIKDDQGKAPDLAIFISEEGGRLLFQLWSPPLKYNMMKFTSENPLQSPRIYSLELLRRIENLKGPNVMNQLGKVGLDLFEKAIPPKLQHELWKIRDHVKTLQINSDEPWIPWEVCKLQGVDVGGNAQEGGFFAEAFSVTRWFSGVSPEPHFSLAKIALVVPSSDLEHADEEKAYVMGLANQPKVVVNEIDPTWKGVTDAMAGGRHDAWHFTGHARASPTVDADQSVIDLNTPDKLTPTDISGETSNLLNTKPFVFLNACQTAQGGMSLTDIGGWAKRFINVTPDRPRAAVFIGTYWSVDDGKACAFAKALYEELKSNKPIGEAARQARMKVQKEDPNDTSWLAYTVYADPRATLKQD